MRVFAAISAVLICTLAVCGCEGRAPSPTPDQMTPIKAGPGEVHTETLCKDVSRPRVKLRKNKDDTYSWDISGDDVEKIIEADRRLREAVGTPINKTR